MIKTLIIISLFTNVLIAKQNYGNVIVDKITSIYDGDTFRVNIKSYPPIRVNGIDTPEIRGSKCKKVNTLE